MAPGAQRRAGRGPEGRLLRAGRVQPVGVALRGDRLSPQGRPRGLAGGPARLPLLRALRRGRPGVRAGDGPACRPPARTRSSTCSRSCAARPAISRRRPRGVLRRRAERPGRQGRRGLLPGDGPRRPRVLEHPRPAHDRDPRAPDAPPRAASQGHRLGAQHPHRRRPLHRHGRRRHGERRPAGARAARRRGGRPGRVRLAPRQRDRRRRVGGPDGSDARSRRRARGAGRTSCTGPAPRTNCSCSTASATTRTSSRSAAIARSAWCTTPSASDTATTCRPSSPAATTPSAISTRLAPCTRCTCRPDLEKMPETYPSGV